MTEDLPVPTITCSTVVELLRWRATHQPNRHAYTFLVNGEMEGVRLSYGELDQQARAIACQLQRLGATGERVLLLYPPGLEFIAAFFGCLYARAVAVPAYPARANRSISRIQAMVADAQATMVLTTTSVFSDLEQLFAQTSELKALRWLKSDQVTRDLGELWQAPVVRGDSLAYLQYTSGSTSTPKGVMVSHENVLHNSEFIKQASELTSDSVSVSWLPHFHDMGLIDGIIQPLYTGFPSFLMPPVSFLQQPIRWLQAISRYRATHCGGPNFAYELCLRKITPEQRETLDMSSWCNAYNGAEPVRQATLERFVAFFKPCGFRASFLYPCYGLAEATLVVSGGLAGDKPVYCEVQADILEQNRVVEVSRTAENVRQLVGCGRSWLDTKIVIADPESLRQCVPEQVGEIWVSGSSVAQGYWNRPKETDQTFQAYLADTGEGPFLRTGDLGFLRDGELFITGRLKELVIIRGRNHYPQDIELTVEQSHQALRPGCGAALAVEVEGSERLVIVQEVERSYLRKLDVEVIAGAIRQAVAQQHELQVYAVVLLKTGRLPKTTSGKIQRHACREGFLTGTLDEVSRSVLEGWDEVESEEELTRTELLAIAPEERLQKLVNYLREQVLRVLKMAPSQLDLEQPLLQLGLDSLMAVELKHRLEVDLGAVVSMVDFLQGFSIIQLSRQVSEQLTVATSTPLMSIAMVWKTFTDHPLSFAQQRLWFLDQLEPGHLAYNVPIGLRLTGSLNVTALEQSLNEIVRRHEALRTTFATVEGRPIQVIAPAQPLTFSRVDLRNLPETEREGEARRLATEEAQLPFELSKGPLLRHTLLQLDQEEHMLLLTMHHIISDGWSLGVFLRELATLYAAFSKGNPSPLPELPMQYADFARWQRQWLQGEVLEAQLSYWKRQLGCSLPVLQLPTDRPRLAVQRFLGTQQSLTLSKTLTEALKALSRQEGVTLFMTLLAAFQTLLHFYTGQNDIIVGTDVANRNRAETENLIGFFVNQLVLRTDLSGNPTFRELLRRVREVTLGAYEHQDLPFDKLVEVLKLERNLSHTPLFQAKLVLQNAPMPPMELLNLTLSTLKIETGTAKFDLLLNVVDTKQGLVGFLEYNTDLFDGSTITRMLKHWEMLLQDVVTQPNNRLNKLKERLAEADMQQQSIKQKELKESNFRKLKNVKLKPLTGAKLRGNISLSFAQQRLWFLDQLEPGHLAYNVPIGLRLTGSLNVTALEQSLNEIVRRHEALRTTFATVEGRPIQVIAPAQPLTFSRVDLRNLPETEREGEARRLATEEAQLPFELSKGPLLRHTLLQLDQEEHMLLLTMHHIISDGWSLGVFLRELATLYAAFSKGNPSPLPELPMQYADFARWQRQWLQGEVLEAQLSYWKRQLGCSLPVLQLPTDRPRLAVQRFLGTQQSLTLSKTLTEALKALSRQEGVTLFMTLLAAFQTLLHFYTGQNDIIVGTDVANRNRAETENLIGFFVNQLVLRTDLSGNPTFRELLRRVREVTLGAYEHQDLPFDKLVEVLKLERNLSHTPLFQAKLVLQNAPMPPMELLNLTLSTLKIETGTAKFDLLLNVVDTKQGLVGFLEYNTDLFDGSTITRMLKHWEMLLQDVVTQPNNRLNKLKERLAEADMQQQSIKQKELKESNFRKLKNVKLKPLTGAKLRDE
jgi:non-ribosomal peptide synthetase component F/aryl carrier-like protein